MTTQELDTVLLECHPAMLRFAYQLTHNREDAHDLVQDAYLKAYRFKAQFIHNMNIKSWMMTVLHNTFINTYRVSKHRPSVDRTRQLSEVNSLRAINNVTPESIMITQEIERAINNLEGCNNKSFRLHLDGYKYEEIVTELHVNMNTVKGRILRARRRLMIELKEYVQG